MASGPVLRRIRPHPFLRRPSERGIALVSVLLALALLGVIAASFLRETRTATLIARNLVENAKAEALADAGVERAMLGLLDDDRNTGWRADGRSYELRLGEGRVEIRLQDEAGKIDLNRAPEQMLKRFFLAVGLGEGEAGALVDAIMAARRQVGDNNAARAPFENLGQIGRLPGMSPDVEARLAPYLTVYSGRESIDPAVAPPLLRQLLPTSTVEAELQPIDRAAEQSGSPTGSFTVMVLAEATTGTGGQFTREAVVQRTDDPAKPFRILLWRQRWPSAASMP